MSRTLARVIVLGLILSAWGSLLWGALALTQGTASQAHSICGVWGCGPPTQVLIGCHAFWFVLLGLPAGVGIRTLSGSCLQHLGKGLLLTSVLLILAVCAVDLWNWWPGASEQQRNYVLRRIGFAAITNVEIPGLEVLAWSLILIRVGIFKTSRLQGDRPAECELLRERRRELSPAVAQQ